MYPPLVGEDLLEERDCVLITFVSLTHPEILPLPNTSLLDLINISYPTVHSFIQPRFTECLLWCQTPLYMLRTQ